MSTQLAPPILRRILASELKRLRREKGVTQQEAADAIGIGDTALSRYEGCVSSMQVPAAENLFSYYGLTGDQLGAMIDLVEASRKRGKTIDIQGTVWEPLENLVALERDATSIRLVATQVLPGLMQTEPYARELLKAGALGADVDKYVAARIARSHILDREDPVTYWTVICEGALRCAVGGKPVMRDQLNHLLQLTERANITLQVLPQAHGAHPGTPGSFMLLNFAIAPHYGIVYVDYLTGSRYIDDADEVAQYENAYLHLIKQALPEQQSADLIKATIKDLYT